MLENYCHGYYLVDLLARLNVKYMITDIIFLGPRCSKMLLMVYVKLVEHLDK